MSDPYLIHDYLVAKYGNPEVTKASEKMDVEDDDDDMPTNAEINDLTDMGYGGKE